MSPLQRERAEVIAPPLSRASANCGIGDSAGWRATIVLCFPCSREPPPPPLVFIDCRRSHILSTQLKLTATTMTGKAKPKKHTAKEIAAKVDAATTNRGGGKAGLADRSGSEKGGHAKFVCPLCKTTAPDIKSMEIHHESKHPKIPFDETKLSNLHATHAVETSKTRPGIRGSFKK